MKNAAPAQSKRDTVVLLRWVLVIAFSYLLLLDDSKRGLQTGIVGLIASALASNLVVARLPRRWIESHAFDFAIVLFDAGWVTLGLTWAPTVSSDLFLLYFLVIFVAAMGESLQMIVLSATLVSLVYGATLSFHGAGTPTTTALLRVPFLFVVALFYGYFVTEIRGRRTEATQARLREAAKGELLAAVSHDLRGPLGNAENLLSMLIESTDRGAVPDRSLLLRAQVNVRRVSLLVTNLLQAACIDAGQVSFQLTPVLLNDVVDDVFNLEIAAAQLKRITIRTDLSPEVPALLLDLVQIGRIVANLVNNAIKYTDEGGTVTIRTSADADAVGVDISDTGQGMSTEQREELFAPYRRVNLGTLGTGLGLYIAKRLTEAQGGQITVASQVGVGSTFSVRFPRTARPAATLRLAHGHDRALPQPAPAIDAAA